SLQRSRPVAASQTGMLFSTQFVDSNQPVGEKTTRGSTIGDWILPESFHVGNQLLMAAVNSDRSFPVRVSHARTVPAFGSARPEQIRVRPSGDQVTFSTVQRLTESSLNSSRRSSLPVDGSQKWTNSSRLRAPSR